MARLRALTFDFWGTLYQNAWVERERIALLAQALQCHGQPRDTESLLAAHRYGWSIHERYWREERRSISIQLWLDEVLAFLGADLPPDARADLCPRIEEIYLHSGAPQPVAGVTDVIPRLADRYRLGLISDVGLTPGRVLRELLRRDGLLPFFQQVTFSDEFGATKPTEEVFLHTVRALGVRPDEAAHIGDLPETDIAGARTVGMRAILFLGISDRQDGLALADAAYDRYDALEAVLRQLDEPQCR